MMTEEMFDILDENGNKMGTTANKKEVHERGFWHSAVHIWIYNSKGEILLQKRAEDKDYWPGKWDISAAGHISSGEKPEQTAIREIKEELGITAKFSDLIWVGTKKHSMYKPEMNYHNNEINHIWLYRFDGNISEMTMADGEVEKVKFMPLDTFEREVNDPNLKEKYVPHDKHYSERIINAVKAQLGMNYDA